LFNRLYPILIAMTRPTDDPNQTDLVAGYILDDLTPEEVARLNQAVAETPALYEEIASFGEAFSLIPYDMPIVEPSVSLKDKIISAASRSSTGVSLEPPHTNVVPIASPRQRSWKRWIPAISTGIAAVAVTALGLSQIQLSRQSQQTVALQQQLEATNTELERLKSELQANQGAIVRLSQPDTQVYSLVGATSNPNNRRLATARLFAKPDNVTITLVAQDLPKLPNNQIYRLWSVAKPSAAPMYCGQFHQDDKGTAHWVAPNVACTKKPFQLLITLDAPTDPITSAGPLVMRSLS
jgi:Anti-sigma-K factor rskA